MNEWTVLFCYGPILIGVGLPVLMLIGQIQAAARRIAKRDADEERKERALRLREEDAARKAALHEAKMARENNLVVLQDTKLELELLKIQTAKRKLGINDAPFVANDYPDPHVSSGTPPVRN